MLKLQPKKSSCAPSRYERLLGQIKGCIGIKQSLEKRALMKVKIRKMRAEADLLESKVKAQAEGEVMLPMLTVRKAWRACESMWVQQCRTIARQVGANWGELGQEIEALMLKMFTEMFKRMAGDPVLTGKAPISKN